MTGSRPLNVAMPYRTRRVGSWVMAAGMGSLLFAFSSLHDRGWSHWVAGAAGVLGLLAGAGMLIKAARARALYHSLGRAPRALRWANAAAAVMMGTGVVGWVHGPPGKWASFLLLPGCVMSWLWQDFDRDHPTEHIDNLSMEQETRSHTARVVPYHIEVVTNSEAHNQDAPQVPQVGNSGGGHRMGQVVGE